MTTTCPRPVANASCYFGRIVLTIGLGLALAGAARSRGQATITLVGTNVVLSFPTATNRLYDVQRRDDLTADGWSTLASNIAGTGGMLTNIDIGAAALSQRFYRVRAFDSGSGTVFVTVNFTNAAPAAGALVLIAYAGGSFHFSGASDSAGELTITNVPVGSFTVRAYSPDNGDLFVDVAGTMTVNGGVANVTVTLPGTGTADVLVNYANGSPAQSAPVYIIYAVSSGTVTNGPQDTAISGHVIIQSVPVGNFTVTASNPHNLGSSASTVGTVISNGALANVTVNLLTN